MSSKKSTNSYHFMKLNALGFFYNLKLFRYNIRTTFFYHLIYNTHQKFILVVFYIDKFQMMAIRGEMRD